jgi:hypothetical protein
MTGKPVLSARERKNVLFPDPARPVTRTRRPMAKAASLIGAIIPQVPNGGFPTRRSGALLHFPVSPLVLRLIAERIRAEISCVDLECFGIFGTLGGTL